MTLHNGKRVVYWEDIMILNVCGRNSRTSKYMKQKLIELRGKIDKFTITVEDLSVCLPKTDRTTRQKNNKLAHDLNNRINQQDLKC